VKKIFYLRNIVLFFFSTCPEAHKYFVEYISKAYQALTDPVSRENYEKYGHPDGRQVNE
jgi:preprotein translocase subunit Sec63